MTDEPNFSTLGKVAKRIRSTVESIAHAAAVNIQQGNKEAAKSLAGALTGLVLGFRFYRQFAAVGEKFTRDGTMDWKALGLEKAMELQQSDIDMLLSEITVELKLDELNGGTTETNE